MNSKASRSDLFNSDNKLKIEQMKILFQFIIMAVCSSVIGALILGWINGDLISNMTVMVSTHFEEIFKGCENLFDHLSTVLIYALPELICILVIFCASFATFNYIATDIVIFFCGFKIGMSVLFLASFLPSYATAYHVGYKMFFAFVLLKLSVLIFLVKYSYTAAKYSYSLKKITFYGRPNIKMKVLFPFLISTLTYIGSVIIINGIYCWLISIF